MLINWCSFIINTDTIFYLEEDLKKKRIKSSTFLKQNVKQLKFGEVISYFFIVFCWCVACFHNYFLYKAPKSISLSCSHCCPLQVVPVGHQPSHRLPGLALHWRILQQELPGPAWHLLRSALGLWASGGVWHHARTSSEAPRAETGNGGTIKSTCIFIMPLFFFCFLFDIFCLYLLVHHRLKKKKKD